MQASPVFLITWMGWLIRFGWPALIGLGVLDASVVPLPGSLDLLTIILAANNHEYWPLYAAASWTGSMLGGFLTFRLGQKGGKELLEKRVPARGLRRVSKWMESHSSLALFLPTLLPPPTPLSYFILAAGAMQVSLRTFLLSFGIGRAIRYGLLAYFATRYGRQIIIWTRHHYSEVLIGLLALAVIAALMFTVFWWKRRHPAT